MVRNANGIGDDGQRRIDRTRRHKAGSIYDIKIVQVMSLAMWIEHAGRRIDAHAASPVLMAYTLQRNPFLEIRMERDRSRRMACPPKYIDPAIFEAIERLNVIGCVRKLNPPRSGVIDRLALIGAPSVSRRMGTG